MIQKLEYINSNGIGYAPSIGDIITKLNEVISMVNTQTDVLTQAEMLPRPEWSEENEENLESLTIILQQARAKGISCEEEIMDLTDWLKSFCKPEYCENCKLKKSVQGWKPSEEQMR